MKKIVICLCMTMMLLTVLLSATVYAADDLVFTFENEDSLNGWSLAYLRYNFEPGYFNGYATEKSANLSDPMFISPEVNINADVYKYAVVSMKYSMDANWSRNGRIFFLVPGGDWDQAHSVGSPRYENLTENQFVNIVYDMSSCELWTGNISRFRFDPFDAPGSIGLRSITFTDTLPTEEIEEKPTVDPETPKKQTGVFLKPYTYADNFADVPASEWYAAEVAGAYELGLVSGKTESAFDPDGSMTVAEAITLAARTRNAYGSADEEFAVKDGEPWYAPYAAYAESNGIIAAGDFSDYEADITRGEMALVFSKALPAAEYAAINSVASVPDVAFDSPYFAAVYRLYNAGVVMGNDAYGTFEPASTIKRSEAAAIINRIANKEKRLSKNLLASVPDAGKTPVVLSSEPKILMEDRTFRNAHTGGLGGSWRAYALLGQPSKNALAPTALYDTSDEYATRFERDFFAVSDGVLDLSFGAVMYGRSGAYLEFTDSENAPVVRLSLEDGVYRVLAVDGSYTDTGARYASSTAHITFKVNLDASTFEFGLDGAYIGTYPLAATGKPISRLRYGTTEKGQITITANYAYLTHNYIAKERFAAAPANILPYDIRVISDGGKVSKQSINTDNANGGTVALESRAGGKTGIAKSFAPASGNVVFETYLLLPTVTDGAKVALTSGSNEIFSLVTNGGNFVAPNGETVKYVTRNLWTIVRFEADTATDTALVKINGKAVGTYPFASACDAVDGYEISYTPAEGAVMYVDDITAFVKLPYPEDYVPEPVVPDGSDYLVGLNVCSLWRQGTHYGWDPISAYPELTSVLGYYDEGSPEVSDWEIKMMSEHGIDYEIFCWYADADVNKPIFRTRMNEALIDGYMNARYSDKLDFAIMWENTSVNVKSFEAWKEYFVPYIVEYFFKDERYVKIDNKPLFTIWSLDQLNSAFGGTSSAEALDYLREECKKAGFDGCTVMIYSSDTSEAFAERVKKAGADCVGAYHWGSAGADADKQLTKLSELKNVKAVGTIPTVSVGFDYVGWGSSTKRNGLLDPAEYPRVTDYIKNSVLAGRDASSPYSNMVIISTWNEYGEGTYVMPTARHGFAYLDAVRKAFTKDDTAHNDITPTDAQRGRINYLFDQSRQLLRPQLLEKSEAAADPYAGAEIVKSFTFEDAAETENWANWGIDWKIENGIFTMTTASGDPAFFRKQNYSEPVSAASANGVKIRAKITANTDGFIEVFFRTNDGKDYAADKAARTSLVLNEWHDYYFDFSSNPNWKGNIVNLRIDPASFAPELIEIESISFVKLPEAPVPFTVDIIGGKLSLIKEPDRTNGGLMIPVYPESGVFSRMGAAYSWNKATGELTVYNNAHTVSMTIGTDKIVIDGKSGTMYAATYFYDGLPVIPFDTLCEALGCAVVYHEDGNGVSIMLGSAEDYEIIKTRKPYQYEFNLTGDIEDWSAQGSTLFVKGGVLHGNSTSNDPAVISPALSIEAEKYPTITVRMKWDRSNATAGDYLGIYFKTSSTGLAESRKLTIPIEASSGGEFREFTFNASEHLQWNGKITGIRVDPFNAPGTFEIDYIRFEMDKSAEISETYAAERAANLDDTVANGDAAIKEYNPMKSDNATVTVVERNDAAGDYCYDVTSKGGKTWTYCTQPVKFTPGTTYVVEFDVRLTGTVDKNTDAALKTSMYVNLQYDGGDKRDHNILAGSLSIGDGWTHLSAEVKVGTDCNNEKDIFSIYSNPIGDLGVNYQLDNIRMTKKAE